MASDPAADRALAEAIAQAGNVILANDITTQNAGGGEVRQLNRPIPALDEAGLEGWDVVNFIPKRGSLLVSNADEHFTGAYFILRKEITPDDIAELDQL